MTLRVGYILVPIADNKGKPMPALHQNIEAWLCTVFGGFTSSIVNGAWVHEGTRYDDVSVKYEVHYHDRSEQAGWLRDIAHKVMEHSDQLSIAAMFNTVPCIIPKRKVPKLTDVQIRAHNNARDQFNLDRKSLLRAIDRAEALRPANGGRSGANDAVLGLRISIAHIDEAITRIDKLLADDRKNA